MLAAPPSFARHVGFAVLSIAVSLVILAAALTVATLAGAGAPEGGAAYTGVLLFAMHLTRLIVPGAVGWLPILGAMILPGYWIFRGLYRALSARGQGPVVANLGPALVVGLVASLFHGMLLAPLLGEREALLPDLATSAYTLAGSVFAAFLVLVRRVPA